MKKCKFCQADLAENGTFCPSCGRDNAETETTQETVEVAPEETVPAETEPQAEQAAPVAETPAEETPVEEPKKATPGKIAMAVAAVVVLAAVLIALIVSTVNGNKAQGGTVASEETTAAATEETVVATVPADGNPDDITCKGTYTVDDDTAIAEKDTVVATIGEHQLTNAQLRIYYRSALNSFLNTEYGYYMMMYGLLDYTQPLDTQIATEESGITWQQYFLRSALENWQLTQALAVEAEKAGMGMEQEDQEYMESLRASLEETAAYYSMTLEDMLLADFGAGVSYEEFEAFQKLCLMGNPYYTAETEKFVPTQEELEAYFAENEETFTNQGITKDSQYVDVRHILIQVEGGTTDEEGNTVYSDEEWAACEAEAQAILDQWLAGEKTEDSFAALANEKSEDPGSNTNGGLYENVYVGQMVEPFETWCFDESRAYGDYGLVQTSYGYHVMYFVGSEPIWVSYAESSWVNEQINQYRTDLAAAYPMEVIYENISLGNVETA